MQSIMDNGFYDRRIITSIIFSLFLHSVFFYFTCQREKMTITTRIDNIEFIDETASFTATPSLPKKSVFQAIKDRLKKEEIVEPYLKDVSRIIQELPVVPGVDMTKGIDIDDTKLLDRSQAEGIDLDEYRRMEGVEDGVTEVLRIASKGEQKGTGDILKGAPIKIDEHKRPTKELPVGLFASPGGGKELDLEKVPTKEIKRDSSRAITKKDEEPLLKQLPFKKKTEIKITGSLAQREIKYRPLPSYPDWAIKKGLTATIALKIMVDPDGSVKPNIFVIKTSGFASWDGMVVESIGEWRFAPLHQDEPQRGQTGIVIIRFILE